MNEVITRKPFDLYQLHLFKLVAETRSFTQAARATGLTQSAISRQIQALEGQLEVSLLNRSTRTVSTTVAGQFLLTESEHLLGDVDHLIRRMREEYAGAPREVRVGVSNSISAAYLPGFFSQRDAGPINETTPKHSQHPTSVVSRVTFQSSATILEALENDALDLGVLFPPARLSARLQITHRFQDSFTLIAHAEKLARDGITLKKTDPAQIAQWIQRQPWLALSSSTQTAGRIDDWLAAQKLKVRPAMELDNFDLIINLVAVGLGVSLVPQRALALYNRRRSLVRLPWQDRFERELVVLIRQQRKTPEHIRGFVDQILF